MYIYEDACDENYKSEHKSLNSQVSSQTISSTELKKLNGYSINDYNEITNKYKETKYGGRCIQSKAIRYYRRNEYRIQKKYKTRKKYFIKKNIK